MNFLRNCLPVWHFPTIERPPIVVEAEFDWRQFSVAAFDQYDVPLPPTLFDAVGKRQAAFLAGRLCARSALGLAGSKWTAVGLNDDRSPEWPIRTVGSITHTAGIAAAVVGKNEDYRALGIDYECLIEPSRAHDISDMILTNADKSLARSLEGRSFEYFLTLVFSLKESLYKALYPGMKMFMDFQSVDTVSVGDGMARLRLNQTITSQLPDGMEFEALHSHADGLIKTLVFV